MKFLITFYVDGGSSNAWADTKNQALILLVVMQGNPAIDGVDWFEKGKRGDLVQLGKWRRPQVQTSELGK